MLGWKCCYFESLKIKTTRMSYVIYHQKNILKKLYICRVWKFEMHGMDMLMIQINLWCEL